MLVSHRPPTGGYFFREGAMLQPITEVIRTLEFMGHEKFYAEMLKWLIEKGIFKPEQKINPLSWEREVSKDMIDEFRVSQKYDVIVFGEKHWLLYEAISYETAKRVCSAPCTRGQNWFLGFSIHGQFKNIKKGHNPNCEKYLTGDCDCQEVKNVS